MVEMDDRQDGAQDEFSIRYTYAYWGKNHWIGAKVLIIRTYRGVLSGWGGFMCSVPYAGRDGLRLLPAKSMSTVDEANLG